MTGWSLSIQQLFFFSFFFCSAIPTMIHLLLIPTLFIHFFPILKFNSNDLGWGLYILYTLHTSYTSYYHVLLSYLRIAFNLIMLRLIDRQTHFWDFSELAIFGDWYGQSTLPPEYALHNYNSQAFSTEIPRSIKASLRPVAHRRALLGKIFPMTNTYRYIHAPLNFHGFGKTCLPATTHPSPLRSWAYIRISHQHCVLAPLGLLSALVVYVYVHTFVCCFRRG